VLPVGDGPSQELAVFGRTALEDVNETRLPPLPHQILCLPTGFGDKDLHNGEMLRLSQVLYSIADGTELLQNAT